MYGKWVTVNLGDDIECKVWITCVPSTPEDELQRRAMARIQRKLPKEKKNHMEMYADALEMISDYEYSQGYGVRWEAEQKLKKLLEEV